MSAVADDCSELKKEWTTLYHHALIPQRRHDIAPVDFARFAASFA
ncbi:hypothetical protein A4U88_0038 [Serratia marcescens]|nr:hypothetical protein A4U88_0038 [Serratia marcescens]CDJ78018.1 Hypothetical protein SMB2099_3404 [Serratia marcescens SMB2099]